MRLNTNWGERAAWWAYLLAGALAVAVIAHIRQQGGLGQITYR